MAAFAGVRKGRGRQSKKGTRAAGRDSPTEDLNLTAKHLDLVALLVLQEI